MNICMIGTGYVGLVTGACFAEFGVKVICVDQDAQKVDRLRRGEVPIYEPGLTELVKKGLREGRLSFTTDIAQGVEQSLVLFIAVGTPPRGDGSADLSAVEIDYEPAARCVESKSLKLYLWSFRDRPVFAEALAVEIAEEIRQSAAPRSVRVVVRQRPRGGITLEATAELR